MGRAEDIQRMYRERAKAEKAAAANGKPEPTTPAPESVEGDWELPGDHPDYLATAVVDELSKLAATAPGARNGQLFVSAKALGQFEDVDRRWLRTKLREACEINGHTEDDGEPMVTGTIKSGFVAADDEIATNGYRDPNGPTGGVTVTEVSMSAFGMGATAASSANTISSNTATVIPLGKSAEPSPLEPVMARIIAAEGDFWERPSLKRIYDAGIAQMVPPWALLAQCCGRALALVPVRVRLPGVIGSLRGGSLNWFAAVVAESGQGKSAAADLAEELVPGRLSAFNVAEPVERNVGSGEGIIHAFVYKAAKGGKTPSPAEFYPSILFSADEIDALTANAVRQGSTILPVLRQAFTGATLGFAYAKSTNNYHLPKHSYRLVFMLSGQPSRYDALLSDHRGGTPQRFQWFPAFDLRIADIDPTTLPTIAPLMLPAPGDWAPVSTIDIPLDARRLIRSARVDGAHGVSGGMSSHEVFVRAKHLAGLAVLDGRTDPTLDDWRRAGIAMEVSRITREWVQERLADAEEEDDTRVGKRRAVISDASDLAKAERQAVRKQAQRNKVADWIRGKLAGGPMKQSALINARRHERHLAESVLNDLVAAGQVDRKDNKAGVTYVQLSKLP